jgi:hypothetical protein
LCIWCCEVGVTVHKIKYELMVVPWKMKEAEGWGAAGHHHCRDRPSADVVKMSSKPKTRWLSFLCGVTRRS